MVVKRNYSISDQAYSFLLDYAEQRYGQRRVYSEILVNAIRWVVVPTDSDRIVKQRINAEDLPEYVEPFKFKRGQTTQVYVTLPKDLSEEFTNSGSQGFGKNKIGKYLSRCIFDYCYLRPILTRKSLERDTTDSEWKTRIKDNYDPKFTVEEFPGPDSISIPKTYRFRRPIFILLLRDHPSVIYDDDVFETVSLAVQRYNSVSQRTFSNDIDILKDKVLIETVNPIRGSQVGFSEGWFDPNSDEACNQIETKVKSWAKTWIQELESDAFITPKQEERLDQDIQLLIDRYSDIDINLDIVHRLKEIN